MYTAIRHQVFFGKFKQPYNSTYAPLLLDILNGLFTHAPKRQFEGWGFHIVGLDSGYVTDRSPIEILKETWVKFEDLDGYHATLFHVIAGGSLFTCEVLGPSNTDLITAFEAFKANGYRPKPA